MTSFLLWVGECFEIDDKEARKRIIQIGKWGLFMLCSYYLHKKETFMPAWMKVSFFNGCRISCHLISLY